MILITLPLVLALFYEDVTARPAAPLENPPAVYQQSAGDGSLDIAVRDQLLTGSVPRGAQRVPFMTVELSAGCDAPVTVDSMTVTHRGLGDSNDIRAVYLTDATKRLSRAVHFDSKSQEANLRLRKFTIPACGAATLSVLADISQTANIAGEHSIVLLSADAIHSTARTQTLSRTSDAVKVETKPVKEGVLTVRMLSVPSAISYGLSKKTARLAIASDGKADHMLRSITLTNLGSARGYDLRYNYLETSTGKQVTTITQAMDLDKLTLTFDPPYLLKKNSEIVFVLRSDVKASYKTVRFSLEDPSDLNATLWKKS